MSNELLSDREALLVEAVARRVVELLEQRHRQPTARQLVDAATLSRSLGVSRETVYEHWQELGGLRLGGDRGRLRFNIETALAAWTAREDSGGSHATDPEQPRTVRRRRRPTSTRTGDGLLPIGGARGRH